MPEPTSTQAVLTLKAMSLLSPFIYTLELLCCIRIM